MAAVLPALDPALKRKLVVGMFEAQTRDLRHVAMHYIGKTECHCLDAIRELLP